jgi:glutaconate CoA-transferase subunit A
MAELVSGEGPLFMDPDPEAARASFRNKSRALTNKVMSVKEAVSRFVRDGDYVDPCRYIIGRKQIRSSVCAQCKGRIQF